MTKTLHFTLGPVQSFVASARRTRDLWAGSFLLSYLSGHAMKAVLEAGGQIIFPAVVTKDEPSDALLAAIIGTSLTNNPRPVIGSLPNRFKASVPDSFDGNLCKEAVQTAWQEVADKVWYKFVFHIAEHGEDTQKIWDRQIARFWDTAWVMGNEPAESDGAWLDQRKNWRTYQPSNEGGDHCTLMGDWQELSGYIRAKQKDKQNDFWQKMREHVTGFNLGDKERLCAVALIKRLYPLVAKEAIGWELKVKNWPSTSYMAAIPWLEQAASTNEVSAYLATIQNAELDAFGEYNTNLNCLQGVGDFARLDGNYFHKTALENPNATPDIPETLRPNLLEQLGEINRGVENAASPFYALLLMDGDSLGKLLQSTNERTVSKALAAFTDGVDEIVSECCGKTVYAGGDDVLALLPLDSALGAANALKEAYLAAFKDDSLPEDLQATISGAIIFTHYNQSFRAVLKEAHHQLDDIAKEQNGRDSLAVAVLTSSGKSLQWVSTWTDNHGNALTEQIAELANDFEQDYSSGFFYNMRERFSLTTDTTRHVISNLPLEDLLVAEYLKNRERSADKEKAKHMVGRLVSMCREHKKNTSTTEKRYFVDGALLVRFLAGKGRGRNA